MAPEIDALERHHLCVLAALVEAYEAEKFPLGLSELRLATSDS